MRHALLIALLALLVAAVPATAQERPRLRAVLETCEIGALPAQRVATFMGSMPARAGADRMGMRFDLERRRSGGRIWRPVRGVPGFGTWERSLPRRAGFVFHKRVAGLRVSAVYRSVVRFRWYAADGTVTQRAQRRTRACRQLDLRPDLEPGSLTAVGGPAPGLARYSLVMTNTGRSEAGPFAVRVATGVAEVARLGAGERRTVAVLAPACAPGTLVAVAVDADQRIEEAEERGNSAALECPLGGA